MPLKDFLSRLDAQPNNVNRALRIIAARLRNTPISDDDEEEIVGALDNLRQNVQPDLTSREKIRLASFELHSEQEYLPGLLEKMENLIGDYAGARAAVDSFGIKWFATLPLSNTGKQTLAATLIKLCKKYCGDFNPFWKALVDGDSGVLEQVSFDIINDENRELGR